MEESVGNKKYSQEFREEAAYQVPERGYSVEDEAERLGV
jgi:transposase-like protein